VPKNRILDLTEAPREPLRRLMWLSGVMDEVATELNSEYQRAYFDLRLEGRLDEAIDLRLHSPKRVMAFTRAENESRGRLIRWGDRRR
jgi:hypothetical protein